MSRIRAIIVLGLVACSDPAPTEPLPGARVERISRELMREFPDVQHHFDGMSYDEAFRAGGDLTQRGLPRLNDRELLDYMRDRHRRLSRTDDVCAVLVGGGDETAVMAALEQDSEDQLRAGIRRSTRAQQLELRGGPRPMTPEQASRLVEEAIDRIRATLTADEAARWDVARSSEAAADACFVERTAVRELLRMPASDAARYQRALLEATLPSS